MSRKVKYIYSENLIQQADQNAAVKGRVCTKENICIKD